MADDGKKGFWGWIRKSEAHLTLLFACAAIAVSVYFGIASSSISQRQTDLEQEQKDLAQKMATQGASDNLMNVLDIVSRSSSELGGWATVAAKDGLPITKMSSNDAISGYFRQSTTKDPSTGIVTVPYSDKSKAEIQEFQLRLVPINSLNSIGRVLTNDPAYQQLTNKNDEKIDLALNYLLPIISPKVQSDDPAVAASALIVSSLLIPPGEDRKNGNFSKNFRNGNFVKVRFNWPNLDLSSANFGGAQFGMARITDADFSNCELAGASFFKSYFEEVNFSGVRACNISRMEQTVLRTGKDYFQLHYGDNKRVASFEEAEFHNCIIGQVAEGQTTPPKGAAVFVGCLFDKAKFFSCEINNADFSLASCTELVADEKQTFQHCIFDMTILDKASLEKCAFYSCRFDDCSLIRALLNSSNFALASDKLPMSMRRANFSGTQLKGASFDGCNLSMAKFGAVVDGEQTIKADLSACNFKNCKLIDVEFDATVNEGTMFENSDLTHADFGKVVSAEFEKTKFLNNVNVDWMIIPSSENLTALLRKKDAEQLQVRNGPLKLGTDSLILMVSIHENKYRYAGALKFKDGDKFFDIQDPTDNGSEVFQYVRKGSMSLIRAGLRATELEDVRNGKAKADWRTVEIHDSSNEAEWELSQLDKLSKIMQEESTTEEVIKSYLTQKWEIEFGPFEPAAPPTKP